MEPPRRCHVGRIRPAPTGQRAPTLSRDRLVAHPCDVAACPCAEAPASRRSGPPAGRHHVTTIDAARFWAGVHAIDVNAEREREFFEIFGHHVITGAMDRPGDTTGPSGATTQIGACSGCWGPVRPSRRERNEHVCAGLARPLRATYVAAVGLRA